MCDTSSYFLLILSFVERQQFYHFVRGYLCAKYPLTNPVEPPQTAVCLMFCIYYVFAIVLRTTSCLCPRTSHMALRHPCLRCFSFNPDRNYVNNGVRAYIFDWAYHKGPDAHSDTVVTAKTKNEGQSLPIYFFIDFMCYKLLMLPILKLPSQIRDTLCYHERPN